MPWPYRFILLAGAAFLASCGPHFPNPGEPIARPDAMPLRMGFGSTLPPSAARRELPDFSALVAACGPAVVNVSFVQQPGAGGEASGFVVSEDGYVLTSAHAVRAATLVTVKLIDRREFSARVVGADPTSDIAVLKIDATRLPTVRFGDPTRVAPGQWVVAIGSPFGFENSVTVGVVSGVARSLPDSDYSTFIQTDVALNPGNSGGPLFNLDGEVIGINSQIISRSGGYMGMSFATPIDVVRDIQKQLIASGRVVRGRMGIATQEMNAQLAESFGLDRARGILVSAVEEGSPAEKYGIKAGDVILQINGARIEHNEQVFRTIAGLQPGTAARVTVWRNRASRDVTVVVEEVSEAPNGAESQVSQRDEPVASVGLSVRALTPEERNSLETKGALVVTRSSGAAALAGIEEGDLLLSVNGTSVGTTRELQRAVAAGGRVVALLIQRDEHQLFVPVPLTGVPDAGSTATAAVPNRQAAD